LSRTSSALTSTVGVRMRRSSPISRSGRARDGSRCEAFRV
jgi:hypothetical protein